MLGTQEAIRQSQAKEKREEHRARRCNLIVGCVRTSVRSRAINGKKIVLRDHKLYIDTENAAETDESSGHPFAGYYLPYPDSEYEGLVSTITHIAPILNWIYIDKDTFEVKYGVRDLAQPHLTGPFDCTRQDRRLTFEDWEGFVAVEEAPMTWALYFDRDDTGLKGKIPPGQKVLEVVLTRQERKKLKEEAQKPKDTDKEKAEQAGDHQGSYIQGAAAAAQGAAPDAGHGASPEPSQPHVLSAADLAKLKIGTTGPSSVWSDHVEGTVSSPTEPWGAASMWSNQEQQAASGAASHLAPFTPSSSIYGDDDAGTAVSIGVPEETTPGRTGYRQPYVEDEASATKDLIMEEPKKEDVRAIDAFEGIRPTPVGPVATENQEAMDAGAGAEPQPEPEDVETVGSDSLKAEPRIDQQASIEVTSDTGEQLETRNADATQHDQDGLNEIPHDGHKDPVDSEKHSPQETSDQLTTPQVDFQVSHSDHDVPPKESVANGDIAADKTDGTTFEQDNVMADQSPTEAELQLDMAPALKNDGVTAADGQRPLAMHTELAPVMEEEVREPVSTPVEAMRQLTPGLHGAEPPSPVDNLPAWATLPEPYWKAAPASPPRSHFSIEEPDTPRQRNFSRPQHSIESESSLRRYKSNTSTDDERLFREDSAPPVTISREPYPVEDDPTSTDTSLVDTSYTAHSPCDEEDATAEASEQQAAEGMEPTSTQSSVTLGEPGLQGNRDQPHGKGADGSMQSTSTAERPKMSWRRSLASRLKVSKESVLKRSRTSS
ncbi:uncharacterized protein BKCO1_1000183 [Diplodia corticola]|uniref:Uncharacterized protein n=1 Tax=Diplodia corticola TaxID=236234 RepID=A0A1J9S6P0_9PEZI|nr:uncharacterized protein BKCO1_1000183 [Diplodia corticola]OJD40611.1 hypothetical protein BKCO1_1000183 [Diplodia corticola]